MTGEEREQLLRRVKALEREIGTPKLELSAVSLLLDDEVAERHQRGQVLAQKTRGRIDGTDQQREVSAHGVREVGAVFLEVRHAARECAIEIGRVLLMLQGEVMQRFSEFVGRHRRRLSMHDRSAGAGPDLREKS